LFRHLWEVKLTYRYIFALKFTLRSQQPDIVPIICYQCHKFAAGVLDTGGKFAADVIDITGNFFAGVVDTGGKFASGVADTSGAP
jgi:hypothetical protein